jgi:chemotaxis protein methyltransferase CheR
MEFETMSRDGTEPRVSSTATASAGAASTRAPLSGAASKVEDDVIAPFAGSVREYVFTERDFERVKQLIYARAGISLSASKQDMVYSRLARRLRTLKMTRFRDYLDHLESADDADEWQSFVNALTTNLTSFFREPHHFTILRDYLLRLGDRRPIRIWCSASSTGEEPYSLAMTAVDAFNRFDAPVSIVASDIDTQVLEFARRGVYPLERVERLPQDLLRRFFLRGVGPNAGSCRVVDRLRGMITFEAINLLDRSWPLNGPFDAIFCRNVMIYFDKPTQLAILRKMVPLLAGDGLFFAGHSESFFHAGDLIKPVGRTVYRPVSQSEARS